MPERDKLDLLIDSALESYAQPVAGLEQRILARVAERGAVMRGRRWMRWAIALPAAVCLFVLAFAPRLLRHIEPDRADRSRQLIRRPLQSPSPNEPASVLQAHARRYVHSARRTTNESEASMSRPKLDVFPSPQPLTPEEQTLLNIAVKGPDSQRAALEAQPGQGATPLHIATLQIPPLESNSPDQGNN